MPGSQRDRPTMSHEHVFMLTKRPAYFYDDEAVKEKGLFPAGTRAAKGSGTREGNRRPAETAVYSGLRTLRSVWLINPQPSRLAHYAGFPEALITPMVKAGTSERGACPLCGSPWSRVVERKKHPTRDMEAQRAKTAAQTGRTDGHVSGPSGMVDTVETIGWAPTCDCPPVLDPVPQTVLDIFCGSGTTGVVCKRLGRSFVGLDLNENYTAMAEQRIAETDVDA